MLAIKVKPNYNTRIYGAFPRVSRVRRILLLAIVASIVVLWLTAELVLQLLHKATSHVTYQAWDKGWLGCGWRKSQLLSYWNTTHLAVTGETNCVLPGNTWLLWRRQEQWIVMNNTSVNDSKIIDQNWMATIVRPITYDEHHYVYRGLIPIDLTNSNHSLTAMSARFTFRWSWDHSDAEKADTISVVESSFANNNASTLETDFIHYSEMPSPSLLAAETIAPSSLAFKELNIAMIADNQYKKTRYLRLLRQMASHQPNFWIHGGDSVQHGGRLMEWETDFFSPISMTGLNHIPLLYARGNHDDTFDYWSWGSDHGHIYHQPQQSWFAITLGSARWIVLDSNRDTVEQKTFLRDELNSAEAAKATFVIVVVHVPPFIEYWDKKDWIEKDEINWGRFILDKYAELFDKHRVDLVISGHQHNYQRGYRNGTTYTIIGGGGGDLDDERIADWHMYTKTAIKHHYAVMKLTHDKLIWNAYDISGNELDTFELTSTK
ncbi:Metallo-dependent phosphatase-like protein [Syncephalis fuscata]|nr:Metallo-dependent phosphatase-like protein [Syncephalis fuscata]